MVCQYNCDGSRLVCSFSFNLKNLFLAIRFESAVDYWLLVWFKEAEQTLVLKLVCLLYGG